MHFLNNIYKLIHPLLGLQFLVGYYISKAIVKIIKVVIYKFRIVNKWGVYIVDNVNNYDTYVASLVKKLRPSEAITLRRS